MLTLEFETTLVEFLALVYNRVPWGKMHTRKNYHDIFNHRVRAATRRATLYEFASKLCNYFGLQSLPSEAQEKLDILRPIEGQVLNTLASEHIPYCVRGIVRAKELKKKKEQQQDELFSGTV